jgi:hypothetical protein
MASDFWSWNWSLTTMQVTGSAVSGPFNAVTVGGDATVAGEQSQNEDAFGAPGIIFRPRPPSDETGSDGQVVKGLGAETLAARMGDRLTPFTWRDLRLNKIFPAPQPGTIALVGYGGGYLSLDDTPAKETELTLRVPYSSGREHVIVLDPNLNTLTITHGDGASVTMTTDQVTVSAPATVHVNAPTVLLGSSPGNPVACVADLVSVAVPAMTCNGVPVIPVNPLLVTAAAPPGIMAVGQIISGRGGVQA